MQQPYLVSVEISVNSWESVVALNMLLPCYDLCHIPSHYFAIEKLTSESTLTATSE